MNKRYMDFVPVSVTHRLETDEYESAKKPKVSDKKKIEKKPTVKTREIEEPVYPAGVKFGVIEDLNPVTPKFVKTEVEKRPLSAPVKPKTVSSKDEIYKNAVKSAERAVDEEKKTEKTQKVAEPKKSPFVNTEKVDKRPLSKSVSQKKIEPPKEENSKSITIITSEKKDSKIGAIVAVIITIILGATAGTVAFLLLPK